MLTLNSLVGSGLAQVTLAGEKSDWENILGRLDYLDQFGEECQNWKRLLVPVCRRFVHAFDDPHSEANLDFWRKIAHREDGMSGASTLTGWITAFCAFNDKGEFRGISVSPARCLVTVILIHIAA
jgi:hypothetical protein